ncbi:MAG TPA: AAA family ATPase [Elusimicrobia bacterium]|nr:AAA family ATPase [Elusimicrobiota bacterium]
MTYKDLEKIIAAGESAQVEFKESFGDAVIESLVAMANAKGGAVLVGIADRGEVAGTSIPFNAASSWLNEIKTKTSPSLLPDIKFFAYKSLNLAILTIPEYPIKPVSFKGRYFLRVGSSNHLMRVEDVARSHYNTFNTSWDYTIAKEHSLGDISLEKVDNFLSFANKNREIALNDPPVSTLRKLELLRADAISKACFLLFMKEESLLTTIEIGRFQTKTLIKDATRIKTDLFSEVDAAFQFLIKHLSKKYIITGKPQREERWEYPLDALREIIINAIVHRDYSCSSDSVIKIFDDKIEFFNPGRLFGNLTVARLLRGDYISTIRNKQIAGIFKEAGIMEKYGSGIGRIIEAFRNSGLPAPKFRELGDGFLVTVYNETPQKTPQTPPQKTPQKISLADRILSVIASNPSLTRIELATTLSVSPETIKEYLEKLRKADRIRRIGPDKGGHWKVLSQ